MRRTLLPLLFFFSALVPLYSWHALPGDLVLKEGDSSLSFETHLSSISIKEYVLAQNMTYILSRLDWELQWVTTTGVGLSYQITPGLIFSSGINVSLPTSTGTMDDYDWAKENASGYLLFNGVWSHYSHHENVLKIMFTADFNLFFHHGNKTKVYYGGGLLYKVISMDGMNGYYQHPSVTNSTTPDMISPETIYGHAISYTHHSLAPYIGIGLRQEFGPKFFVNGFALGSPLAWAWGLDTHWISYPSAYDKYTDYLEWDLYLFFSIKVGIHLSHDASISLGWAMTYQPRAEGNTKVERYGTSPYVVGDSGGGSFFSQTVLLRLSLRM